MFTANIVGSMFNDLRTSIIPPSPMPTVTITEQPTQIYRFRYVSEIDKARFFGSLPGASTDNRCYPTIRVDGYRGPYAVLLSLINSENNYVHPHAVRGTDPRYQCKNGTICFIAETPEVAFNNICIVCVKEKTEQDVREALAKRCEMGVDPFGAGYAHINNHSVIDFTAVRLCFQVFLPGDNWTPDDLNDPAKYSTPLEPVISTIIYDAKKYGNLKIHYVSSCAGPVSGGTEMHLWCENKFTGQNPHVIFSDNRGWTQKANITEYHKQIVMRFNAPPYPNYKDCNFTDKYEVFVCLEQSTKRGISRSLPATVAYDVPNKKKQRPAGVNSKKNELIKTRKRSRDNLTIVDSSAMPGTSGQAQPEPSSIEQLPVNHEDTCNNELASSNFNNGGFPNSTNEDTSQPLPFHSIKPLKPNLLDEFTLRRIYEYDLDPSMSTNSRKNIELGPVEWNVPNVPIEAKDIEVMSISTLNTSSILSEILDIEMQSKTNGGNVNLATNNLSEHTINHAHRDILKKIGRGFGDFVFC